MKHENMNKYKMKAVCVVALAGCLAGGLLLAGCSGLGGKPTELTKNQGSSSVIVCTDGVQEGDTSAEDFSYQLFKGNLSETNPVMSPVSAYFAMSMVGAGANGQTRDEFHQVFGEDMVDVSGELMATLPVKGENLVVNIANSAWVDDNLVADEMWLGIVTDFYDGEVYQIPLTNAMDPINDWAAEKTEGMIKGILDQPLSPDARLAVLNAIYFNGKWQNPFEPEATTVDVFTTEDGTVDVDMMYAFYEDQQYIDAEGLDGVVLPYLDGNYAFVAMKPTDGTSVREMYEGLTMTQIAELVKGAEPRLLNLKLPKFEVEYDKILNEDFIQMGVKTAFEAGEADFSGLGTSDDGLPMFISLVRQKAVIKVDEEGTEAAAVTAVIVECGSAMPVDEPIDVFFDEPFFYMIYDTETQMPLFMGIFDEPVE